MSQISRLGTNASFLKQQLTSTGVQADMDKYNGQVSSGVKGPLWQDYGVDTLSIVRFQSKLNDGQGYIQASAGPQAKLKQMSSSCESLVTMAGKLRSTLDSDIVSNGSVNNAATYRTQMASIASLLNASVDGSYIFGGQSGDTPPVDLTSQSGAHTVNTAYYKGASTPFTFKLDDTLSGTLPITAASSGFEKLLRAARMAQDSATDTTTLKEARILAIEASHEIATHTGDVGASLSQLEQAQQDHEQTIFIYEKFLGELINADPIKASEDFKRTAFLFQMGMSANNRVLSILSSMMSS